MSGREITYNCPACQMVFFGPFVICHLCGYSKIEAARKRELAKIADDIQDLTADLKADNDRAEAKEASVWGALDSRIDDAYTSYLAEEE